MGGAVLGILVIALIFAPLFLPSDESGTSKFCAWVPVDPPKSIPKGWKTGLQKFRTWLKCDGTSFSAAQGLRVGRTESYLQGLESPGMLFRIDLQKQEGEKLGFSTSPKTDYLEVGGISGSGAIAKWNKVFPLRKLALKDRIITINGYEGNGTVMADELRAAVNVSLRVFRIDKSDTKNMEKFKLEKEIKKIIKAKPPPGLGEGIPEPSDSKVVVLHANNIEKFIEKQPVCLVMFYAHWCGHCQQSAPGYTKAAGLLANEKLDVSTRIAKFNDGDQSNQPVRAGSPEMYNFTSYPSFILFQNGKKDTHLADMGPEEMVAALRAKANGLDIEKEVEKELLRVKPKMYEGDTASDVVYDLDPDNFDDVVLKEYEGNNAVWIIEFYSDKCPFCKSLKPEIVKASHEIKKQMGGRIRIGAVNSRAFNELAKRFGVTSYPWIISVYANKKNDDMAGLGGADSVVNWAKEQYGKVWKDKPKWSDVPILVPESEESDNKKRGKKEVSMFSNSTGSWRELLGRRTWFFLHTLAAKYPESPTEADKEGMRHIVADRKSVV